MSSIFNFVFNKIVPKISLSRLSFSFLVSGTLILPILFYLIFRVSRIQRRFYKLQNKNQKKLLSKEEEIKIKIRLHKKGRRYNFLNVMLNVIILVLLCMIVLSIICEFLDVGRSIIYPIISQNNKSVPISMYIAGAMSILIIGVYVMFCWLIIRVIGGWKTIKNSLEKSTKQWMKNWDKHDTQVIRLKSEKKRIKKQKKEDSNCTRIYYPNKRTKYLIKGKDILKSIIFP